MGKASTGGTDGEGGPPSGATLLLERWKNGDEAARDRFIEALHDEMRAIARRLMSRERSGHTLQPTAVVAEACLRLLGTQRPTIAQSPGEFLGLAAHVMRQVLVDHARKRDSGKRGGAWRRITIAPDAASDSGVELVDALDLDAALTRLAELSPLQARIAELRFFVGLNVPETAEALGTNATQVKREWAVARLWLQRELDCRGKRPERRE